MEENKKENNKNREETNFENVDLRSEDFDDAEKISSLINSIKKRQIQNNSEIIKDLKTGIDLEEKKLQWKLICLLGKIRKMEDRLPVFLTQEIDIKLPNFSIFLKDHFHLLFKSAEKNHQRIQRLKNENPTFPVEVEIPQEYRALYKKFKEVSGNKNSIKSNSSKKSEKTHFKFRSFMHLKNYQKKMRRITFSFSSVLAMVLIAAVMITYVFKPSGAEASAFQFAQSSWAG